MTNRKLFIAIAGNIGSGKTTLTRMLANRFQWEPYFEAVDGNPYLSDFYLDMKRWSFQLQVFFLSNRLQVHQKLSLSDFSAIQDRSIYEDAEIFARNLYEHGYLEERDYQSYLDLYSLMTQYVKPPDLIIYLKKSLPVLKARIQTRGRNFEKQIPDQYLQKLNQYYDEWIYKYKLGKKLIIESDQLDFQNQPSDFDYLIQSILNEIETK